LHQVMHTAFTSVAIKILEEFFTVVVLSSFHCADRAVVQHV
jgi:hypothetical protein